MISSLSQDLLNLEEESNCENAYLISFIHQISYIYTLIYIMLGSKNLGLNI